MTPPSASVRMMVERQPVGVREFREKLQTYREPVTVIHTRGGVKVLGQWIPEGWSAERAADWPITTKKARGG